VEHRRDIGQKVTSYSIGIDINKIKKIELHQLQWSAILGKHTLQRKLLKNLLSLGLSIVLRIFQQNAENVMKIPRAGSKTF